MSKWTRLLISAGAIFGVAIASAWQVSARKQFGQKGAQMREMARGGVCAAAVLGDFEMHLPVPTGGPATIEDLLALADLVVIAWPGDNLGFLDSDGNVRSKLSLEIVEVLGARKPKAGSDIRTLPFQFEGGAVVCPGGNTAQVIQKGMSPPMPGNQYLLFLRAPRPGSSNFVLAGAALGAYRLTGVTTVRPSGNSMSPLGSQVVDAHLEGPQFVQFVRTAIETFWKAPPGR